MVGARPDVCRPIAAAAAARVPLLEPFGLAMASRQSPGASKRPRLSLQIKTSCAPPSSYSLHPSDPTSLNTLSNAYLTAMARSSEPITAINTLQAFTLATPADAGPVKSRIVTPYVASFPETPLTAHATSPSQLYLPWPSTRAATPPPSADMSDTAPSSALTLSSSRARNLFAASPTDGPSLRPKRPLCLSGLPYSHPRTLHSILRNSPLPPRTAIPPPSPRRQSLRLQEKAAKKVGYNSPLTQGIVTNKYTKSHIDLLGDEASPCSPALNTPLAFTANEVEDGGQTPNPFGTVRRSLRATEPGAFTSAGPSGTRKRKRAEKKRRWVWTIGQDDDGDGAAAWPPAAGKGGGGRHGYALTYAVDMPGFSYL